MKNNLLFFGTFCKIYNYISEVDVMINQETLNKFDKLYNESYKNILKYVICNCSNVEDVEDIVQNVYVDLLKKINKINIDNGNAYVMGIIVEFWLMKLVVLV